mmetsp:Transcript_27931/g.88918  ORF Transcript_27931/g.88918 Transcript_27931/m.88918 type:complete len:256 (-) Transcript_27931:289-1056(-)
MHEGEHEVIWPVAVDQAAGHHPAEPCPPRRFCRRRQAHQHRVLYHPRRAFAPSLGKPAHLVHALPDQQSAEREADQHDRPRSLLTRQQHTRQQLTRPNRTSVCDSPWVVEHVARLDDVGRHRDRRHERSQEGVLQRLGDHHRERLGGRQPAERAAESRQRRRLPQQNVVLAPREEVENGVSAENRHWATVRVLHRAVPAVHCQWAPCGTPQSVRRSTARPFTRRRGGGSRGQAGRRRERPTTRGNVIDGQLAQPR